jgi:hypothetical protein
MSKARRTIAARDERVFMFSAFLRLMQGGLVPMIIFFACIQLLQLAG